jgi:hypothetical protein
MKTVREDGKESKMYSKGKDIRKKRHQIFKLPNLCGNQLTSCFWFIPSVFGEKLTTAEF